MFLDTSALVAVILLEPEAEDLDQRMTAADRVLTSALVVWEASQAVARVTGRTLTSAHRTVRRHIAALEAETVGIGIAEEEVAVAAAQTFGKGRHPAKLNMADCFSYACARVHAVPLLYRGDDFALTDIERA